MDLGLQTSDLASFPSEFRRSCPHPKLCLFRIFVWLKGLVRHFSAGVSSLGQVAESCQTSAGMGIAP